MAALSILLLVIFAISALLLLLVVLIQDEQGEGIGGIFGGGGMSGQIGNRKGNILTRFTTVLGIVFLISSLGLAWVNKSGSSVDLESAARQAERENATTPWYEEPADAE